MSNSSRSLSHSHFLYLSSFHSTLDTQLTVDIIEKCCTFIPAHIEAQWNGERIQYFSNGIAIIRIVYQYRSSARFALLRRSHFDVEMYIYQFMSWRERNFKLIPTVQLQNRPFGFRCKMNIVCGYSLRVDGFVIDVSSGGHSRSSGTQTSNS